MVKRIRVSYDFDQNNVTDLTMAYMLTRFTVQRTRLYLFGMFTYEALGIVFTIDSMQMETKNQSYALRKI